MHTLVVIGLPYVFLFQLVTWNNKTNQTDLAYWSQISWFVFLFVLFCFDFIIYSNMPVPRFEWRHFYNSLHVWMNLSRNLRHFSHRYYSLCVVQITTFMQLRTNAMIGVFDHRGRTCRVLVLFGVQLFLAWGAEAVMEAKKGVLTGCSSRGCSAARCCHFQMLLFPELLFTRTTVITQITHGKQPVPYF